MSTNPYDGSGNQPNPNAFGQTGGPPPKKSKTMFWLFGCLGLAAVMGLVCCGGSLFMTQMGMKVIADQIKVEIQDNPAIEENIGEIESLSMSWGATMQQAQKSEGQASELAFEISGTKGSGVLLIKNGQGGQEPDLSDAKLIMEDGTEIPLDFSDSGDFELNELIDEGQESQPEGF